MSRRLVSTLLLLALLTLSVAAGRTQERPLVATDLHQKAHQRGTVRVLVQIDAPYVPEIHLPSRAHVTAQRRNVTVVQDLVRGSLGGVAHRVVRDFRGALPLMAIEVGPDGLRMLESMRGVVAHVVEDRPRQRTLAESVPRIQANQAAALGYDGSGAVIVIMDTGVEKSHPFLQAEGGGSKVVAEACFSTNFSGDLATSLCPGGVETSTAVDSGLNCSDTIDGCDHGTLVAGIAAGRGASFNGVAPGADLVSIQVFSRFDDVGFCGGLTFTPCVGSYPSDEVAAAQHVLDNLVPSLNIASINLSLGSLGFTIPCDGSFPGEAALIGQLRTAGVATVAASGNEGLPNSISAPACIGAAISVGATTDPPEAIASFSNRAPGMSLLAPGVNINTSAVGGGFETVDGTSMSTPMVAGAYAIFKQALPSVPADEFVGQVLTALQSTGQPIGAFRRIKILDALATFTDVVPTIQFSNATYTPSEGNGTNTVTVTVTRTGSGDAADAIASSTSTVLFSTTTGSATPGTTGTADYVPVVNQLVTFGPGEVSKTASITVRGDFTIEPNETVGLVLSSPSGAVLGTQKTAVLTIVNDDVPGVIEFQSAGYAVVEGAGPATITLKRTGGLAAGTTATVSTVGGGTATAGADYTAVTNKVVTFAPGATTATFTVTIVDDTLAELDEIVNLQITGVSAGATIGVQNTATLEIASNDIAGSVQFNPATYEVTEGTATRTITVTRSGGNAGGVTVQYRVIPGAGGGSATGGGVDYTLATGTLTFGFNEMSKTFNVSIVNDALIESDETVNLELFNPQPNGLLTIGAQGTAVLTIHDNDAPTFRFGAATYSVAEGAQASVTVVRANGLGTQVTVGYAIQGASTATGGGTDYTLVNGTVTFGVGITTQTIPMPTVQDTLFEGGETIVLMLVNPSLGAVVAPATTTVTITDNDAAGVIQFSAATYSVMENAGPATVRVNRTGTNLASGVTVQFTTTNGTATAGADYTTSTQVLTFAALEAFKNVQIPILNDGLGEGNETVALTLTNPSPGATLGSIRTAVLTILDDEQALQFSAPVYVVTEATTNVTVTVIRTGPTVGTVTVNYATVAGSATAGSDYTTVGGILTFGPGVTTRTFVVPIISDTLFEGPAVAEAVALVLSNPGGGAVLGPRNTSTITIVDNDPPGSIRFSAAAYSFSEAAGVATITVQRTGGTASAVTVDYATVAGGTATGGTAPPAAGVDYITASGTLTFAAGVASRTFTIPIVNDLIDEPSETVNLALSNPTGGATLGAQSTAVLTITDNDVPGPITFSAPNFTVAENVAGGNAMIKVNRGGGAAGVTVDLTTVDGSAIQPADYTDASQTLTFAAGETSKLVLIPIVNDTDREGNETVRLILSNPTGGATLGIYPQATLTITDNETGPTVQFGTATYSVAENAASGVFNFNVTITRTGSTTPGQAVLVTASAGTATPGVDFTAFSNQTATFTGTQTSLTFPVQIINNTNIVGSRTVNLTLSSPTGGLNLGVPRAAVLTILEDDATFQFSNANYAVNEGSVATLTVTRTGGTIGTATVAYATSAGTAAAGIDYTTKAGTLVFGPGVTSQNITVATTNDVLVEGAQTFTVTLSNPSPAASVSRGAPSAATVTINDNDAAGTLQFSSATYSVTEGGTAALTVTRTGGTAGPVTVQYATSNGSATGGPPTTPGTDYTPTAGTLTFLNGVTSRTIMVPTKADTTLEGPETFTVALTNPLGGATLGATDTATVTIVDDETPRIQFATANYTVAEAAGSVTLTVTRVGPTTAQITVPYTLAGGSATGGGVDFNSTGGTLTFAPGVTSRPLVVPVTNDTVDEASETFTVTLASPTGGGAILGTPSAATVTITDNDTAGTVQFSQFSYAVVEGGTATITVTRTGGTSGPVTVNFATSDGTATEGADYTGTSNTLTFEAGETTQAFTVTTASGALSGASESVILTLSNPTGGVVIAGSNPTALWILEQP